MAINQRDVYYLPFPLDNVTADHPFIVLSTKEANELEGTFVGVMITSSEIYVDDFSFPLNNDMFDKPLKKLGSHVRMHLITVSVNGMIVGNRVCSMKESFFKQLMASMGELVFGYTFKKMV